MAFCFKIDALHFKPEQSIKTTAGAALCYNTLARTMCQIKIMASNTAGKHLGVLSLQVQAEDC